MEIATFLTSRFLFRDMMYYYSFITSKQNCASDHNDEEKKVN